MANIAMEPPPVPTSANLMIRVNPNPASLITRVNSTPQDENLMIRDEPRLRPSSEGGSSGHRDPVAGGAVPLPPPPEVPPLPDRDYWLESEDLWTRAHIIPRFTRFYPGDARDGPSLEDLQPMRTTPMLFTDGAEAIKKEV